MKYYTLKEWRRCKTTLETSGEDVKLHSKRVEKMPNYTRNECSFSGDESCLEKLNLPDNIKSNLLDIIKRRLTPQAMRIRADIEASSPLVSSVILNLFHSFRV